MEITRFEKVFEVHGEDNGKRIISKLEVVAVSMAEAETIAKEWANENNYSSRVVVWKAFDSGKNFVIVRRIVASD